MKLRFPQAQQALRGESSEALRAVNLEDAVHVNRRLPRVPEDFGHRGRGPCICTLGFRSDRFCPDSAVRQLVHPGLHISRCAYLPVCVPIVHGDLVTCLDASGSQNDPLLSQPDEPLELRVRFARVVDETCVVTLLALPYLIRRPVRLSDHHIQPFQSGRDEPDELPNCPPFFEGTARHEPVVLPIRCTKDLHRNSADSGRTVEVGIALAAVECWIVRLPLVAIMASQCCRVIVCANCSGIVGTPGIFVDDRAVHVCIREVLIPEKIRLSSSLRVQTSVCFSIDCVIGVLVTYKGIASLFGPLTTQSCG